MKKENKNGFKIVHWHFLKEEKWSIMFLGVKFFHYLCIGVQKNHTNQKNQMIMRK